MFQLALSKKNYDLQQSYAYALCQQPVEAVGNENYFVRCVKQKFIYDIICCAA
jgi:hypothetical protein